MPIQTRSGVDGSLVWRERPFACSCQPAKKYPTGAGFEAHAAILPLYDVAFPEDHGTSQDELDYQRDVQRFGKAWADEWWGHGVDLCRRGHALAAKLRGSPATATHSHEPEEQSDAFPPF
jgi:hypothetical protein